MSSFTVRTFVLLGKDWIWNGFSMEVSRARETFPRYWQTHQSIFKGGSCRAKRKMLVTFPSPRSRIVGVENRLAQSSRPVGVLRRKGLIQAFVTSGSRCLSSIWGLKFVGLSLRPLFSSWWCLIQWVYEICKGAQVGIERLPILMRKYWKTR